MGVIFLTADNQPIAYPNQCVCGVDSELNYHCVPVKDIMTYKSAYPINEWYSTRNKLVEAFEAKKLASIEIIKSKQIKF